MTDPPGACAACGTSEDAGTHDPTCPLFADGTYTNPDDDLKSFDRQWTPDDLEQYARAQAA